MLISSENGGGQIVSSSEDTRFYDDVACLAADWTAHTADARAFVRISGGGWADALGASYAQPADARTPRSPRRPTRAPPIARAAP